MKRPKLKPIKPVEKKPDDVVPTTLQEAVDLVLLRVADPDTTIMIKNPASSPAMVHSSMGQGMRNAWSLWDTSTVLVQSIIASHGIAHADDTSALILHCVWQSVRGEPWGDEEFAKKCKDHWRSHGIDPVTSEKLLVTLD